MRVEIFIYVLLPILLLSGCVSHEPAHDKAAELNIQLALAYLDQGNAARAKEKLLKAQQFNPKSPMLNRAMAYYWERVGEASFAEKAHQKSIRDNSGEAWSDYGAFLCRLRQYEKADNAFNHALKDPHYTKMAETLENRAKCLLEAGHSIEATEYAEKAKQYRLGSVIE